jgi:hypothetical protein
MDLPHIARKKINTPNWESALGNSKSKQRPGAGCEWIRTECTEQCLPIERAVPENMRFLKYSGSPMS